MNHCTTRTGRTGFRNAEQTTTLFDLLAGMNASSQGLQDECTSSSSGQYPRSVLTVQSLLESGRIRFRNPQAVRQLISLGI